MAGHEGFGAWPRCMPIGMAAVYVGLSSTTVEKLRREGDFPKAIALTPGRNGYLKEDLDAWLDKRAGKTRSRLTNHLTER